MSLYAVTGMGLLFVGAVLIVNGLWLLGKADDKDTAILNFLTGGLTTIIALWWAFGGENAEGTAFNAAGELLFAFTYLWVGRNAYMGQEDQRSFGWYCFFVAVVGLATLWWIWSVLWTTFGILLGLERADLTTPIAWYTILVGVVTAIAGYAMSAGFWPWT